MPAPSILLGELLVQEGLLQPPVVEKALARQRILGGLLGTNLLEMDALREGDLLRTLGIQSAYPTVSYADLRSVPEGVLAKLPRELACARRIVPFRLDGQTLHVASIHPERAMEDAVTRATQLRPHACVGLEVRVFEALHRYYALEIPPRVGRLLRRLAGPSRAGNGNHAGTSTRDTNPLERIRLSEAPRDDSLWEGLEVPGFDARDTNDFAALRPERDPATPPERSAMVRPGAVAVPEALTEAIRRLKTTFRREEIAQVVLDGSAPVFKRRLLLAARGDRIIGWRGDGAGIVPLRVHTLNFTYRDSPIFVALRQGSPFWLGNLLPIPVHGKLVETFGGKAPQDCVVLPIRLRAKNVAYLYADNGDRGVAGAPMTELQSLLVGAGDALEFYLHRRKVRSTP